jgi:hypothetical protein
MSEWAGSPKKPIWIVFFLPFEISIGLFWYSGAAAKVASKQKQEERGDQERSTLEEQKQRTKPKQKEMNGRKEHNPDVRLDAAADDTRHRITPPRQIDRHGTWSRSMTDREHSRHHTRLWFLPHYANISLSSANASPWPRQPAIPWFLSVLLLRLIQSRNKRHKISYGMVPAGRKTRSD